MLLYSIMNLKIHNTLIILQSAFLSFFMLIGSGMVFPTNAENNSEDSGIRLDFSTGLPFYIGDFNPLWGEPDMYQGLELDIGEQFNNYGFAASTIFPLTSSLSFMMRAQMATIHFSEIQGGVFFRNVAYDFSGQLKLHLIDDRFGWYLYGGPGVHSHYDTQIYETEERALSEPIEGRIRRVSLQGGSGIEFEVLSKVGVFAEIDWILTGSDRLDGFNGNVEAFSSEENENEKPYFQRDQIVSGRAGIRVNLFDPPRDTPQRPYDDPVTSWVPDPDPEEEEEVEEDPDWPEEYQELNIKPSLSEVTVAITYARDLNELRRQREIALRIIQNIEADQQLEVLATPEQFGYSLHIGTFSSTADARQIMTRLNLYYSGANIIQH